jgi:hypothetical protein
MSTEHPEVPSRFGPALRWVVSFVVLGVLIYGASESFRGGNPRVGYVYAALAAVTFAAAVKWNAIADFALRHASFARRRLPALVATFVFILSVVSSFLIGRYIGWGEGPTSPAIGNVVWNFEQTARGAGYFLNMQKRSDQPELRVTGFGAHGKNNSSTPIESFKGRLRSDLTNAEIPIYVLAQDPDEQKLKICLAQPFVPTLPQETFGIPAFADFDIVTFEKGITLPGVDGMPLSKFMNDFVPFTIFLEYDGTKYERHFTKEEVLKQVSTFERTLDPQSVPRVVRRPTAKPAVPPTLQTLLSPDSPKAPPGLVSPVPAPVWPTMPTH